MLVLYTAIVSMVVVAVLCAAGSFSVRFEDNTMQRIGLALIGFGAALRAAVIAGREQVSIEEAAVHFGLVLFGIGTVLNKQHRKSKEAACSPHSKPTLH